MTESNATYVDKATGTRQRLNDLSGKDWLIHSKSTVINVDDRRPLSRVGCGLRNGSLMSLAPRRDDLKKDHPATFSEKDVARLIRFFTRTGGIVLDPFMGSGSTAVACVEENRNCIGFELYKEWYEQSLKRIDAALSLSESTDRSHPNLKHPDIRNCDALTGLEGLNSQSVDFVITSPPYWGILEKKDHKVKKERVNRGLPTNYGKHPQDLASIPDYYVFLDVLSEHFAEYYRVLKQKSYAAVIVSDFRHAEQYHLFHADVASHMESAGFMIQGLMVLIQDNKKLYPYGYPTTFVPNIANQYIVVGRRL